MVRIIVLLCCAALGTSCASSPSSTPRSTAAPRRPAPADPALAEQAKQEFLHAWNGYKRHAWGHDELLTVSKKPKDWYGKESLLMTPVDTLSTFIIMGLDAEAKETTDYIYLLKCEKLFGDRECGQMYRTSIAAVNKYVADDTGNGLWYGRVDMTTGGRNGTNFGSLHAFLPGVLVMGGDLDRARRLQDSAFRMWTLHGIEPESFNYVTMKPVAEGYQLRPEIVESAYYLSHYTRDPKYLEMGRTMFADLKAHCRTEDGYTVLRSVITKQKGDLQHSFLLAETLKYFYLLFEPSALDFDKVVFNTEAHPIKKSW